MKYVSSATAKMNPKNFFSRELFTEPSKVKLTAVPLHHGNKFPCVPAAHAANTTESYQNMKILL
jgi:hypothetical protein